MNLNGLTFRDKKTLPYWSIFFNERMVKFERLQILGLNAATAIEKVKSEIYKKKVQNKYDSFIERGYSVNYIIIGDKTILGSGSTELKAWLNAYKNISYNGKLFC